MYKQHTCAFLDIKHDSTLIIKEDDEPWILRILKLATEDDLENNHHLEIIGDIIDQIEITVCFCPYCGAQLDKLENMLISYSYNDSSHW